METKTIKTAKPIVIKSSQEPPENASTLVIGDGNEPQESESPGVIITPDNSLLNQSQSIEPTVLPTPTPTSTPTPTKQAIQVKTPVPISTPTPTPIKTIEPKVKQVYFKVRIGPFESRSEAELKVKELESIGYSGTILEDSEGIYIQLSSFNDQERALNFAEEISQKGYSVIIRQIEE